MLIEPGRLGHRADALGTAICPRARLLLRDWFYQAHLAMDATPDELSTMFAEVQAAKTFVNSMAASVVDRALTLSGGAGYTRTHDLSRAYRDVRAGAFMQPLGAVRAHDFLADVANSTARAIFLGHRGEFRDRAYQDQLDRASYCICSGRHRMDDAASCRCHGRTACLGEVVADELIAHPSPVAWEPVNFLGRYTFDPGNARASDDTNWCR